MKNEKKYVQNVNKSVILRWKHIDGFNKKCERKEKDMHKRRIFKFFRATLCATLALSMICGDLGATLGIAYAKESTEIQTVENTEVEEEVREADVDSAASNYGLAENTKDGVILHAFCWSFNVIKQNMKDIAEAGYTTVQTSPANACNDSCPGMKLYTDDNGTGGCWWWHYQPTDWTIGNYQLGTKEDYKAMCDEADKYGIKIITDVIPNHTTPDLQRVASSLVATGGGTGAGQLYHSNGFRGIENGGEWSWGNRLACTTGMMGGLPDVNTENQAFQAYYLKYCNDLIEIGCDGFRYDTAKHIGVPSDPCDPSNSRGVNDFWDVATGKKAVNGVTLKNADQVFIYGEVLQGDNVPTAEYATYMYQTASHYGGTLRDAIKNKDFSTGKISDWSHTNPGRVVSWVESHDTYCNDHESGWMSDWDIRMAWAIIAARKDGVPLWMSRPEGSNGSSGNYWGNNVLGAKGNDQFKDPEVVAVNFFRNAMAGEGEYLRNPNGNNQILQIDRGSKGTCIINLGGEVGSFSNETTMADGTYTDQVSKREFTVSGGRISGKLDGGKIAVIYNAGPIRQGVNVTASVADGKSFTEDSMDVTFTVTNAVSATYSVNGGTAEAFTDKVKLTLGAGEGYGNIKVTITAKSEDGETTTKTFTYTKKEAGKLSKNTVYFTKPSGWGSPKIYAYVDGATATKLTGEWPGTAMTDEGDGVYSYTFADSVSAAKVIFNDGTNQDPQDTPGQSCGFDYASGKAYTYEGGTWTPVNVQTATNTPKPTNTTKPTNTPTAQPQPTRDNSNISVDFPNGSSFHTETKTIKITAANNAKGTYTVDNGPVKEFAGTASVVIGKGKIADSDVTVKITVGSETETYTYKKVFDADAAEAQINAAAEEEAVVAAEKINAAAETGGVYATNPNGGVGKEKTIKSMADFDAGCLVAQSGAWDVPNTWNGAHENSVADCYGLYAAWDDTNLYVGVEYVNTTDTWQREGEASLMDNGKMSNVPVALAINAGTKTAMTGKMEAAADDDYIWGLKCEFETRVDHLLIGSAQVGSGTPGLFVAKSDGTASYDPEYCLSFKENGITYQAEDGSISSSIMHLKGSQSVDDAYDSSKYVDALTDGNGHNRKYDTFFTYTIPLSVLGIDKATLTSNGIGIMGLATRGESCMDSVPHDPSMLDNTMEAYRAGDNTSYEKEDLDVITVPLASVGKLNSGGGGDITPIVRPTSTTAPTTAPTAAPDGLAVNFGADRSAPQYNSTALTLEAIANGGAGSYNYEFFVDDVSVQKGTTSKYKWQNSAAGAHTIKVSVTDSKGLSKTITKSYDLENDGTVVATNTPIPIVTDIPDNTPVPTATNTPIPVVTQPVSQLRITGFVVSSSSGGTQCKIGERLTFRASTSGAEGTALYMFTYILNGEEVIVKNYGTEDTISFIAEEAGSYKFKVYAVDHNNFSSSEYETGQIQVMDDPNITVGPDVTDTPIITGNPVGTITPTQGGVTPTKKATPTPTKKVTPTKKATPTPTKKATPTPTKKATPKPTKKPTAVPTGTVPKPGTIIVVENEDADFKVLSSSGSNKSVEYTKYQGDEQEVIIPSTVTVNNVKYKVTSVAASAFKNNKNIKTVIISSNVNSIGKSAFYGCTSLKKITGASNIKTIDDKAFYGCKSLTSVTMSSKLTSIGKYAFYKCTSLKKITIPAKVSKIGTKAFYGCKNLKTITIKTTKLTSSKVGSSAFKNIYNKATVKVPKKKVSSYKKLLKKKGLSSKAKIKK